MKEISDFSTSVMWWNVKLIHMWRNFRFLLISHVQKFEISPHDRFFLHGHRPCFRDKYQVWWDGEKTQDIVSCIVKIENKFQEIVFLYKRGVDPARQMHQQDGHLMRTHFTPFVGICLIKRRELCKFVRNLIFRLIVFSVKLSDSIMPNKGQNYFSKWIKLIICVCLWQITSGAGCGGKLIWTNLFLTSRLSIHHTWT